MKQKKNDPISDGIISIRTRFQTSEELVCQRADLLNCSEINAPKDEFAKYFVNSCLFIAIYANLCLHIYIYVYKRLYLRIYVKKVA